MFAEVLSPVVTTRLFLKYDESATVDNAKTLPELITKAHPLLLVLHNTQPSLSFVRSTVRDGLQLVLNEKETFGMKPMDAVDWVETMTRRMMNLCRVVSQGQKKHGDTPWVQNLPWVTKPDVEAGVSGKKARPAARGQSNSSSSVPPAAAVVDCFYGYDTETCKSWRQPAGCKGTKGREMCVEIIIPDGALDDASPIARWADGFERKVPELVVGDLKMMQQPRSGTKDACEVYFEGQQHGTHHRVIVKKRTDRDLLVSLYDQTRQVLQVKASRFIGGVDEAGSFMVKIAKAYCEGTVDASGLKKLREDGLALIPSPPKVCKRPAAAAAADESLKPEDSTARTHGGNVSLCSCPRCVRHLSHGVLHIVLARMLLHRVT